jgi:hypothetical protein
MTQRRHAEARARRMRVRVQILNRFFFFECVFMETQICLFLSQLLRAIQSYHKVSFKYASAKTKNTVSYHE